MASTSQIQGSTGLPILELWNGASYDAVAQIKRIDPRVPTTAAGKTTHSGITDNRHSHLSAWVDGGNIGFTANYLETTKDQLDAQIGDGQLHQWRLTWTDPEGTLTSPNIVFYGFITSGAKINMPSEDAWTLKFSIKISGKPVFTNSTAAPTVEFLDNFNDANGTAITSHTADTGQGWVNLSGAGEIQGNRLAAPLNSNAIALENTSLTANGTLSGVISVADVNQLCGLVFRAKDFSNMLLWFYLSGAWRLARYTGGSPVAIATDVRSDGFSAGDNDIKVTMSGDSFTLTIREGQVDEVVLGPYTATTSWAETKVGAYVSTGTSIASRRRHFESLQFSSP